jgi:hypothetical protein
VIFPDAALDALQVVLEKGGFQFIRDGFEVVP